MKFGSTLLLPFGVAAMALPAAAQDVVDAGSLVLDGWSHDTLYAADTWSVQDFFDSSVMGAGGEQIGNVEDLVLNDDGQVIALIAEVGGFWDIGDTHVSIPWDMVQIGADESVVVPVTTDNIAEFDLFVSSGLPADASISTDVVEGVARQDLGPDLWRASDLIGDYVRVQDEGDLWVNFGYVSDLMINEGQIAATLVSTTARYGPGTYAYPYHAVPGGDASLWTPGATTTDLPILIGDVMSLPVFDRDGMNPSSN